MSFIEKLEWDSHFFEINIGKSLIDDEKKFDPIKFHEEAKKDYDLVYLFSYQNMISSQKAFDAKLDLIDIMITMSMPLNMNNYNYGNYDLKTKLTEVEIRECYEIAEQISIVSRFHKEPLIGPEKAKALYRKWIDNSLNNSFCDGILLTRSDDGIITGLHVIRTDCNEKIGLCSLIGVNNNYKGKGIGKKLWEQAFTYWTLHSNISKCKVPFSIKNTESFNFHLKMGFNKIEEIKYIYHYRNNNKYINR